VRHLLSHAEAQDTFSVLTAGTRVRAFANEPRPVTPENAQAAIAFLEIAHLIGALDLGKGNLDLADRAYTAAFEAEPTNAQLLWDRAQNLNQSGKTVAAQRLFRRLAEGKWQPRFQWLQTQARWQMQNR
jgi:hypothetical protein